MLSVPTTKRSTLLIYAATAAALGGIAWYAMKYWPVPLGTVLPAWTLGQALLGNMDAGLRLVPFIAAIPFLIVALPLLTPKPSVSWPTTTLCIGLVVGSIAYFAKSWSQGIEHQGLGYTEFVALLNLAFAGVCIWLSWRAIRSRGFWVRYAAALVPCLWFAWCAFPWLGEMP
jgi:hypothetical protein